MAQPDTQDMLTLSTSQPMTQRLNTEELTPSQAQTAARTAGGDGPEPRPGSRWRHNKSGKVYTVAAVTNLASTKPEEYPPTVVYFDEAGVWWSRPLARWHAGMTALHDTVAPAGSEAADEALGPPPMRDHTERRQSTYDTAALRAFGAQERALERERLCAAIKAADDKAMDEAGYMLDSDDCISVIRGTWNPG